MLKEFRKKLFGDESGSRSAATAGADADVVIYTTRFCPYCVRAKALLDHKGVQFMEIAVDGAPELRREMMEKSGRHTVPQIWIGNQHVGGCDDLFMLERAGELDVLITSDGERNE